MSEQEKGEKVAECLRATDIGAEVAAVFQRHGVTALSSATMCLSLAIGFASSGHGERPSVERFARRYVDLCERLDLVPTPFDRERAVEQTRAILELGMFAHGERESAGVA